MDSNMEHLFDLYSSPDSQTPISTANVPKELFRSLEADELLLVKGRFGLRNGSVRKKHKWSQIYTDTSKSGLNIPSTSCRTRKITTKFASSHIRREMITGHHTGDVRVKIRPKGAPFISENYSYFLVCCPSLSNIITPNGEITKYKAQNGWSFMQQNSPESAEILSQRKKTFGYRDMLQHIFAKIQINQEHSITQSITPVKNSAENILYNTFVETPLILNHPIQELDSLEIVCLWPNGQLVDFQGEDFSMTFEITETQGTLKQVNARTGLVERK
jgi:hypothetical protein